MNQYLGQKVLVTTQSWFYGRDGKQYRAIHGTLKGVHEAGKTLGFIPNRSHANWFIEIGSMIIMGCQIMYLEKCEDVHIGRADDWQPDGGEDKKCAREFTRPSAIYIAE
jgi:hypothetical protein